MSDETPEQVIEPTVEETPETVTPTIEELLKSNEELIKSIETQKKEIAGINKANTTFKAQYDELLKKTETEAETKQREAKELQEQAEQERNEFLNKKAEFSKKENEFNVKVKALGLGFTEEDIEQLKFVSVEHVESTRAYLDAKLEATKEETAKNILDSHSGKPEGYNNNGIIQKGSINHPKHRNPYWMRLEQEQN